MMRSSWCYIRKNFPCQLIGDKTANAEGVKLTSGRGYELIRKFAEAHVVVFENNEELATSLLHQYHKTEALDTSRAVR